MSEKTKDLPEAVLPEAAAAIPAYDDRAALAAIEEIFNIPGDETYKVADGHVLSAKTKMQLDCEMPLETYAFNPDNGRAYVPVNLIDKTAMGLFGDMWDTEILDTQILQNGTRTVQSVPGKKDSTKVIFYVVAQARVKVTLRGENGSKQSHTGVGVSSYRVPAESAEIEQAYHVAVKGAVSDARRNALDLFGRIFNTKGHNQDRLIETLAQRRVFAPEEDGQANPFQIPAEVPAKVATVEAKPAKTKEAGKLTLFAATGEEMISLDSPGAYCSTYIEALRNTDSIEEMENFIKCNAQVLKGLKEKGFGDLMADIPAVVDNQYLGLSEFKGEKKVESKEEPVETGEIAETTPDQAREKLAALRIHFTLTKDEKIGKAKAYIKEFLNRIEKAESREELTALMEENQENLRLLPKKELGAINTIAQARATKSRSFPA